MEIAQCAAALPAPLFFLGKASVAVPFTYHSFNGIRHLVRPFNLQILDGGTEMGVPY
jgi:succinate dehydrogenase/fumarate reductase cytochrome b subunit